MYIFCPEMHKILTSMQTIATKTEECVMPYNWVSPLCCHSCHKMFDIKKPLVKNKHMQIWLHWFLIRFETTFMFVFWSFRMHNILPAEISYALKKIRKRGGKGSGCLNVAFVFTIFYLFRRVFKRKLLVRVISFLKC